MFALLEAITFVPTQCVFGMNQLKALQVLCPHSLSLLFFNATSSSRICRVLVCFILEHYWLLFFQLSFEKLNTCLKDIYFSILLGYFTNLLHYKMAIIPL